MSEAPSTKRQVFIARLSSTLVLWGIVTAGVVLKLPWLFFAVIGLLGFLALIEVLKMFGADRDKRYYVWTLLIGLAYLGTTYQHFATISPAAAKADWNHLDLFYLILHLFGLFTLTLLRPLKGETTLKRLIGSFVGFFYALVLINFLSRILAFAGDTGYYLVLYVIAVTKFTDMGAYVVGSLIGKHKMIPYISPGKTWQGFGGGILGAYLASCLVYFPFKDQFASINGTQLLLIIPFILALATVVGDLAESVLKRCLDVKDSGHMLPGIGGALDLIDSLCFTAPMLYLYLVLFS